MTFIDGNGVGGLLAEVFGGEMTGVERRCGSCGEAHPVGAHRAFLAAATVLRCPGCGDVAARVAELDGKRLVELRGTWVLTG